jgi:hypothetical protein
VSTYPLDRPAHDPRFTTGLLTRITATLVEAGYPPPASQLDAVRLQVAVFEFLYGKPELDRLGRPQYPDPAPYVRN